MPTMLQHDLYGECELVRIEGVNWIIRCSDSGQIYRVPPTRRNGFVPIDSVCDSAPSITELATASPTQPLTSGVSRLLSATRNGNRPPPVDAVRTVPIDADKSQVSNGKAARRIAVSFDNGQSVDGTSSVSESPVVRIVDGVEKTEKRRLRKVFESLRNGLNPTHSDTRSFAVGFDSIQERVDGLLQNVAVQGGSAVVIRGAYGQGKTFCLQLLKQMALESGYAVASVEIDAFENQLDKPHLVYRSLIGSLQFPEGERHGAIGLADRVSKKLSHVIVGGKVFHFSEYFDWAQEARQLLETEIQCRPLAWLLSDHRVMEKPQLLDLLAAAPGVQLAPARRSHILGGQPRDWPAFSAGTQGDFGSYLLSGIGRLTRFLGYKGLILILDEMEKWQDLNWKAQSSAGNLLGGLIWASSAPEGSRVCKKSGFRCSHALSLNHSNRCLGYPFTTEKRCYLGLAIAMTPRGDDGPEQLWSNYGKLEIADIPSFTPSHLDGYFRKAFPAYCLAYGIEAEMPAALPVSAIKSWRVRGDGSTRTAVQSVLGVLDDWRETLGFEEV